jgi:metal-sulfur cluster biosynthetic enzyme
MKNKINYNQIIENLKQVHDPEISINVFDLGLIYNIKIDEKNAWVTITHTLTSAWCGFADEITANIRKAGFAPGVEHVDVITTFDPPFTMESVSEEVKMMMGW